MYTIKQAATRAGVSVPVLRAWERRYRIVLPSRTPAGYRLYDDEAIERIRTMRRLVDDGWQPSQAAREIIDRGVELAAALIRVSDATTPGPSGGTPGTEAPTTAAPDPLVDAFVEAATALDERAVAATLDEMLARGSFEAVATTLLFPTLTAVGDAWAEGRLGVAGEHVASHAVLRRLGAALEATGHGREGRGHVLVGLPPGSRHELGALAFAIAARRAGLPVTYLGPDLPVDDWTAASAEALAAVVGVVTVADRAPAVRVVERLRAERPALLIAVGGAAASGVEGVLTLSPDLPTAVGELAGALHRG